MNSQELKRQEVAMDDAIVFGRTLPLGGPERAMVARHACVLASGFIENVVRTHLTQIARRSKPKPEIAAYVEASVDRFQNPEFEKVLEVVARFSASWRRSLESLDAPIKAAVNSIVANRHLIAHGRHSGISLGQVEEYVQRTKEFRVEFERICR